MPLQYPFIFPLPNGMHARPASLLEEMARSFNSSITITNQRTGRKADVKSVLSIISAEIRHHDHCVLIVTGPDEQKALAKMTAFLDNVLPHSDEASVNLPELKGHRRALPVLCEANVTCYDGTPVVPGVGHGRILRAASFKIPATLAVNGPADVDAEWRLMENALEKLAVFYDAQLAAIHEKVEADLFKAHRAIARDSELCRQLHAAITQKNRTIAGAIADAQLFFSEALANSENTLLQERTLDVQDVCIQLLRQAYGDVLNGKDLRLTSESIVVADSLTPSQFLGLDRRFLKGLVLANAGVTSHTIILARSFGIPTLVGVNAIDDARLDGREAVIDASAGVLVMDLTEAAHRYYDRELLRLENRQTHIKQFSTRLATTADGQRIEIAANIASADETTLAISAGAEAIGLFRTEMLFFDRASPPDETAQFLAYSGALKAAAGRPVLIRTLDVGGDKQLDYLKLPAEENPFLGFRAVRIYSRFEALFRTQIRALIRASAYGQLKIMFPMIATLAEVRWVKNIIALEQARCAQEQIPFAPVIPLGAMIEVPAAAFSLKALCDELDFFSIGSNDLLQYFMAADRTNDRVNNLYHPLQPAFLRLLKQIVDEIHARKKWVGLCGEMGGQTRLLPLLVGLGLDEISAAVPTVAGVKAELAGWNTTECKQLLSEALTCATDEEVETLLKRAVNSHSASLLDPELILINQAATTRAEAIKLATDQLYVLGRTADSRQTEAAVWQREQTYSTGFGHGFAIPHCKTNAVKYDSLVLVKLKTPVDWKALDDKPVHTIILLALCEHDASTKHMRVLARLARLVMDENFRAQLESEKDPQKLYEFLKEKLGLE